MRILSDHPVMGWDGFEGGWGGFFFGSLLGSFQALESALQLFLIH